MKDFNEAAPMPDRRIETIKKRYEWEKARVAEDQALNREGDLAAARVKLLEQRDQLRLNPPTLPNRWLSNEALNRKAAGIVDAANEAVLAKWDVAMKREIDEIREAGREVRERSCQGARTAEPKAEQRDAAATTSSEESQAKDRVRHPFERLARGDVDMDRSR